VCGHLCGEFLDKLRRDRRCHAVDISVGVELNHVASDQGYVEPVKDIKDITDAKATRLVM
jgi:hypothetical protein